MVVNDFNFVRIAVAPDKADSVSAVNSNTVLAGAIPRQFFQAIPWRYAQVVEPRRVAHELQLAHGHPAQIGWHALTCATLPELFRAAVSETDNHDPAYRNAIRSSSSLSAPWQLQRLL